jgi:hypothetical protein
MENSRNSGSSQAANPTLLNALDSYPQKRNTYRRPVDAQPTVTLPEGAMFDAVPSDLFPISPLTLMAAGTDGDRASKYLPRLPAQ